MRQIIETRLKKLEAEGNLRAVSPEDMPSGIVDLSSNDYLGIARDEALRDAFYCSEESAHLPLSSSASRLLASAQKVYSSLEATIADAYGGGRSALMFNSGYHANSGMIPALAAVGNTVVVADKLVHASIIDGMKLSGIPFRRFRHNDTTHLVKILEEVRSQGLVPIVVVESVYSMDGDTAPLAEIADIKESILPEGILYVDEAHAVGVKGSAGLGLAHTLAGVDIVVGTFGKALGSMGAYAVMSPLLREWMLNKCRSMIFSTALSPLQAAWSKWTFTHALGMDSRRKHLGHLGSLLGKILYRHGASDDAPGHIRPLITGSPEKAVLLSVKLRELGFNVLPIRTPTVPPGTDRLRFSLSADLSEEILLRLNSALDECNIH